MVEEKFMLISMDDEKIKYIAEILGNKTCKKILDYLSENNEASQQDLSEKLKIPLNTIEYNIKKLIKAELIQKRKNFFWSKKGKKIILYEISKKSIIISPKNSNIKKKINSILPGIFLVGSLSFLIWTYEKIKFSLDQTRNLASESFEIESLKLASTPQDIIQNSLNQSPPTLWTWFLAGGLIALLIISILNWRKL